MLGQSSKGPDLTLREGGYWVDMYEHNDGDLHLFATDAQGQAEAKAHLSESYGSTIALAHLLDDFTSSAWDWVPPGDIGAMVDEYTPILSDEGYINDEGYWTFDGPTAYIWIHTSITENPVETLADGRGVRFERVELQKKAASAAAQPQPKTEHERMVDFFFPKRRGSYLMNLKSWGR